MPVALAIALWSLASPLAAVTNSPCVGARDNGTGNCTAKELKVALIGLGTQLDGCVTDSDTLDIDLSATIQNQNAQQRYDVGLFVDQQNIDAQSTGSTCTVETLWNLGTLGATACPPLDLSGGAGPYDNIDGDGCGDTNDENPTLGCDVNNDGLRDSSVVHFRDTLVDVPCRGLTPDSNGFVQLASCITWGQLAGTTCTDANDVHPEAPSKCNCTGSASSNIPLPNLALTCGCTKLDSNSYKCAVVYTNDIAPVGAGTCADATTPSNPRFGCGTASFVQFGLVDDPNQIDTLSGFNFAPTLLSTPAGLTQAPAGSDSYSGGPDEALYWNPSSFGGALPVNHAADNIIGNDEWGGFEYIVNVRDFGVNPVVAGDTVTNKWIVRWANGVGNVSTYDTAANYILGNPSQSDIGVNQPENVVSADCKFVFGVTWAAVTGVTAYQERGRTVVEWRTAGEASSLAFDLYRIDPASGAETKVNARKLVAVRQAPGGLYRVVDPEARGDSFRYRIVERDLSGAENSYGPYDVKLAQHPNGRPPMGSARMSALVAGYPSPRVDRAGVAEISRSPLSGKAKILVGERGMISVSATELASAMGVASGDVSAAIGAGTLRLEQGGAPVAWTAESGNAGVRFLGELPSGFNAPKNVYWASMGYGPQMAAIRASAKTGKPAASFAMRAKFEENLEPRPEGVQDPNSDWWFWKVVAPGVIASASVPLDISHLAAGSNQLAVELFGFPTTSTDGVYRASVALNGTSLGEVVWTLPNRQRFTFSLPAGLLSNGTNTLTVGAVKGVVLLNSAEVDHRRDFGVTGDRLEFAAESTSPVKITGLSGAASDVYDITDHYLPMRLNGISPTDAGNGTYYILFRPLAGHRYLAVGPNGFAAREVASDAASSLRDPSNAADYVIITNSALMTGAQALASYRASTGYTTQVVDVQDVYDEFSYGLLDPKAMREFLRYAVANWQTPPTHVVLAGKGTWDLRNLWGADDNFVPPILAGSVLGIVASDGATADFDDDGVPDLSIGRIPAISNSELQDYVAKLQSYETSLGTWRGRAIALADNPDPNAGQFVEASNAIEAQLSADGLTVVPIHLASSAAGDVTSARNSLFSELATGALVFNYVGHGGFDILADEGLLTISDVPSIANATRLPLFVTETCYVGYFTYPGYAALSEHLLLTPDVGTIANWSPAGLSANNPSVALGGDIAARIAEPGTGTLGERVRAALAAYLGSGGSRSNSNVYNLLGDPAVSPN